MSENKPSFESAGIEATLTRLLAAESRAEAIVKEANDKRESAISAVIAEVRAAEQKFESTLGELRAPFLRDAEARAGQEIAELTLKYEERQRQLRKLRELHLDEALEAAESVMLDATY